MQVSVLLSQSLQFIVTIIAVRTVIIVLTIIAIIGFLASGRLTISARGCLMISSALGTNWKQVPSI